MDVLPFLDKFLRNKTDSEIGGDHRQYLICSERLDIRMIIQSVAGEKSGIKLKGFCIRTERDKRVIAQLGERDLSSDQILKGRRADSDLVYRLYYRFAQRGEPLRRRRYYGDIGCAVLECGDSLRGRVIAYSQMNTGVQHAKALEHGQQQASQRHLARRDIDRAALQSFTLPELRLTRLDMLECEPDMPIQSLSLRGQAHSAACPRKEGAAELSLEVFNCARYIGLTAQQDFCCLGDVAVFCDVIKYAVVIIAYEHADLSDI